MMMFDNTVSMETACLKSIRKYETAVRKSETAIWQGSVFGYKKWTLSDFSEKVHW